MKTKLALIALAALALGGCSNVPKLQKNLADFESLGIRELVVTGKFSHTEYHVTTENGVRRAVVEHSNAWVPKVRIVRETKE